MEMDIGRESVTALGRQAKLQANFVEQDERDQVKKAGLCLELTPECLDQKK